MLYRGDLKRAAAAVAVGQGDQREDICLHGVTFLVRCKHYNERLKLLKRI